jgi:hypothetical protein
VSITPAALLAELQADPKHLGYRAAGSPAAIAALLNTVGLSGETCANTEASIEGIMLAINMPEWRQLPQADRDYLIRVSYLPGVNLADPYVQAQMAAIFPAGGKTLANLNTMVTRPCTRVEALFAPGDKATVDDVVAAIALAGGIL